VRSERVINNNNNLLAKLICLKGIISKYITLKLLKTLADVEIQMRFDRVVTVASWKLSCFTADSVSNNIEGKGKVVPVLN
jgi:hypothetical protein